MPAKKCEDYQDGTYEFTDWENDITYRLIRQDTLQKEFIVGIGDTSRYRVHWIDACTYELDILDGKPELMEFYGGRVLTIEILQTLQNGYQFKSHIAGTDMEFYQNVKQIE